MSHWFDVGLQVGKDRDKDLELAKDEDFWRIWLVGLTDDERDALLRSLKPKRRTLKARKLAPAVTKPRVHRSMKTG